MRSFLLKIDDKKLIESQPLAGSRLVDMIEVDKCPTGFNALNFKDAALEYCSIEETRIAGIQAIRIKNRSNIYSKDIQLTRGQLCHLLIYLIEYANIGYIDPDFIPADLQVENQKVEPSTILKKLRDSCPDLIERPSIKCKKSFKGKCLTRFHEQKHTCIFCGRSMTLKNKQVEGPV